MFELLCSNILNKCGRNVHPWPVQYLEQEHDLFFYRTKADYCVYNDVNLCISHSRYIQVSNTLKRPQTHSNFSSFMKAYFCMVAWRLAEGWRKGKYVISTQWVVCKCWCNTVGGWRQCCPYKLRKVLLMWNCHYSLWGKYMKMKMFVS